MEIEHSFADYLYNVDKLKTGRITIGGSQFFISFILPSILEVFKQKYPQVDIVISEASSVALEEQLFNGSLDLAVDSNALSSDIYERFCAARSGWCWPCRPTTRSTPLSQPIS